MDRVSLADQFGISLEEFDKRHEAAAKQFGLTNAEMEIFIHMEAVRLLKTGKMDSEPDREAIDSVKQAIICCRNGCSDMGIMLRSDIIPGHNFGFIPAEQVLQIVDLWPIPQYMLFETNL